MHRIVLNVLDVRCVVDHIDHNGLNNQKANLRICTHKENIIHSKKRLGTSSKYKGVCFDKSRNRWKAEIKVQNKRIQLGRFLLETDAAIKYNEYALKYHGEFANLNII